MIGKYFFSALALAILVVSASVTSLAQVGELRGSVMMQQAEGQKVPLADAQIDVFRTDIKGEYHTKTNKKGEYVFAGLPLVGTYVVVASHATAAPNFQPKVRVGQGVPVEIIVTPGNGKRPTYDEVKAAAKAANLPSATVALTLRHSTISDLVTIAKLDLFTVAKLAGTSVVMIEKTYGKLQADLARTALQRLSLKVTA